MARNFTISLPATAFGPLRGGLTAATITSQAVTNSHRVAWACDDTTAEGAASVPFVCPDEYTGSGTLKAKVFFASGTQNSGSAVFAVNVEAIRFEQHRTNGPERQYNGRPIGADGNAYQ